MSDQAVPESVAGAEQIGLSAREAKASVQPRDAGNWAAKVERLAVEPRDSVRGTNVAGRRLTGPVQLYADQESFTLMTPQGICSRGGSRSPRNGPARTRSSVRTC